MTNELDGYEPQRLIADNDGHLIEQEYAPPSYKRAEAQRARTAARRAQSRADSPAARHAKAWADRCTAEYEAHSAWALDRALAGDTDITFGRFVRDTSVWTPGNAESGTR